MEALRTALLGVAVWLTAGSVGVGATAHCGAAGQAGEVSPCAATGPAAAPSTAAPDAAPPDAAPPAGVAPAGAAAPVAMPPPQAPQTASIDSWRVLPYGKGLVAIIARGTQDEPYGTASVYCDSEYKTPAPVFLYRVGGAVPAAEEVERLNRSLEGITLSVDGKVIQSAGRRDLGHSFSGLQLLPDGTLSYMLVIDPAVLESILHGQRLQAVLEMPSEANADPRYSAQTIPLKNSRKAIGMALQHCI